MRPCRLRVHVFERTLLEAVLAWFRDDWALERPVITTNEHLDHQIATIESLGRTRCFDYDRNKDMYTSYAYALTSASGSLPAVAALPTRGHLENLCGSCRTMSMFEALPSCERSTATT